MVATAARLLGYALAAFLVFMGGQKFMGGVPIFDIIETNMSAQWGVNLPWIEPWFRYLTGALELAAAALLIFRQRLVGGGLALLITIGAIDLTWGRRRYPGCPKVRA